jgi:hypothetical protein
MRRLLFAIFLTATALSAQIQILPDIDVTAESQIKIFLYKKALPYSGDSLAADSISAFFPSSLPPLIEASMPAQRSRAHYLNLEGDTRLALEGTYRYYPTAPLLSSIGARVSWLAPTGNTISRHHHLHLDMAPDLDEHLGANLFYYNSEKDGLDSKYSAANLASYHDDLSIWGLRMTELSSSIRMSSISQNNLAFEHKTNQLMIRHSQNMHLKHFTLGTALDIYADKLNLHSSISTEDLSFEKTGVDLLYNGKSFVAAPSFIWRYVPDFDEELSLANLPKSSINDHPELLERYRWLYFDQSIRNTMIPLNLRLRYEDGFDKRGSERGYGLRLQNTSQYRISDAHLTDSANPDIPQLYFTDVFSNQSLAIARFGTNPVTFEQSFCLDLSYMAQESWVREPYRPLLTIGSQVKLERFPYLVSLVLDQRYFSRDHHQSALPEVIDLRFEAAYDIDLHSQLYLSAKNLLGNEIYDFRSLPKQSTELYAGLRLRF